MTDPNKEARPRNAIPVWIEKSLVDRIAQLWPAVNCWRSLNNIEILEFQKLSTPKPSTQELIWIQCHRLGDRLQFDYSSIELKIASLIEKICMKKF